MHATDDHPAAESDDAMRLVSLKTLANIADAHPTTVRRWLRVAQVKPVVIGRGRAGAIRYRWRDVCDWLNALEQVE